jgi:hypothetical protein
MWHQDEIELIEKDMLEKELLTNGIKELIRNLFKPQDIFSTHDLKSWAEANLDLGDIVAPKQVIAKGWQPEDVFSDEKLLEWARCRGLDINIRRIK